MILNSQKNSILANILDSKKIFDLSISLIFQKFF